MQFALFMKNTFHHSQGKFFWVKEEVAKLANLIIQSLIITVLSKAIIKYADPHGWEKVSVLTGTNM